MNGRLVTRLILSACMAGAVIGATSPPVLGACTGDIKGVSRPAQARGTTFTGTLVRSFRAHDAPEGNGPLIHLRFDVDRAYAGDVARRHEIFTLTPNCHGVHGLEVGDRYLLSTGEPLGGAIPLATAENTLVWRVASGDRLSLLGFDIPARSYPAIFRSADELDEALAIMAPGGNGHLPDTATIEDAPGPESGPDAGGLVLFLLSVGLGIIATTRRLGQRVAERRFSRAR